MSANESFEKERNRRELALRASNEGIWDWWTDQEDIYYSQRVREILSIKSESAQSTNLFLPPFEFIHPDELELFQSRLEEALASSGPEILRVDCRVRTLQKKWKWLRIRGVIVRENCGKPTRIVGSMIDISRRKEAEQHALEERYRLEQLIDHIPLQVYFKDTESRFVLVNRKMAKWNGFPSPNAAIGSHDKDIFASEHWKDAEADEIKIMDTGEAITGKLEHEIREDGEESWVITSKFPWYNRGQELQGTFGISSDVTALVEAERRTAALATTLAERNQAYEEEVQLAREIQHAFISPDIPEITGDNLRLEIDSRYFPLSGLSGDFFQIIPISDHQAGFLICDVMGHGVRSALVTTMIRGLMERQKKRIVNPSEYLGGLNSGLCSIFEKAQLTMFATAFYAVIDLAQKTLSYACAGHPGAILGHSEKVELIGRERSQRGPALGLMSESSYPLVSLPTQPEQRLLLFTDGIFETSDKKGNRLKKSGLLDAVREFSNASLHRQLSDIVKRVLMVTKEEHFDDDVCLLGVEIKEK